TATVGQEPADDRDPVVAGRRCDFAASQGKRRFVSPAAGSGHANRVERDRNPQRSHRRSVRTHPRSIVPSKETTTTGWENPNPSSFERQCVGVLATVAVKLNVPSGLVCEPVHV